MKDNGNYGTVEGTNYCMDSMNARNVKEMNNKMGYHNMSDMANTGKAPTKPTGVATNAQHGPMAANPSKND
jgi:hypothetical protein